MQKKYKKPIIGIINFQEKDILTFSKGEVVQKDISWSERPFGEMNDSMDN